MPQYTLHAAEYSFVPVIASSTSYTAQKADTEPPVDMPDKGRDFIPYTVSDRLLNVPLDIQSVFKSSCAS